MLVFLLMAFSFFISYAAMPTGMDPNRFVGWLWAISLLVAYLLERSDRKRAKAVAMHYLLELLKKEK